MSSTTFPGSRKRFRSPNFRDSDYSDSDDETPPFKIRKKYQNRFPSALKEKLQSLAEWLVDLPVTSFFKMAIKSGTTLHEEVILDEEEEENDDDIQELEKVDPEQLTPLIEKFEHKLYSSNRRHLERNGSYSLNSHFDTHRINGSSSRDWNSMYSRNGDYNSRELRSDNLKRSAVVSNPSTDIEILLGTKPKVSVPEADDIEIVSESPSSKLKQKSFRSSRSSKQFASGTGYSRNSSRVSQSSSSKRFTANQVMRLEEKAQYQLLLQKYLSGNHYHHIARKSQSVDVGTQADIKFSGSHFKKEVLQQPVESFIEQYYKPCQLLPSDKDKQASEDEPPEIKIEDDDEDEELQILEVKLPKCKTKFRSRKYFTPEWINELRTSVRAKTEERLKIVSEQERHLEDLRKERLLKHLRVEIEDDQIAEPVFPELTAEMEEVIDNALCIGPPKEVLCKSKSCGDVLRKDFDTLAGLNWLNDEIINSYFDLIVERSKQPDYPSVYAFNTFFYTSLKSKGYKMVSRWTRKVDIFSFDLNFVPLHLGVHWCLMVIDHRAKKISYYDSMAGDSGGSSNDIIYYVHNYICDEHMTKKGVYLDRSAYATEIRRDIPQQMNGSDCGMFTLKYAEYISRDAEINFNQSHMQYFRRRTVYELLKGVLL